MMAAVALAVLALGRVDALQAAPRRRGATGALRRGVSGVASRRAVAAPLEEAAALSGETKRAIDREMLAIGVPACIQFAAEPLARLVDTAYIGRLGAAALGGAGAAVAAQYAFSKLANDPLLRTSISLVAADGGDAESKRTSVAAALALALFVGVAQCVLTLATAPWLLDKVCAVGALSPMRPHALGYLRIAALGAPTATLWLVVNGIFRGLGDTKTPLVWALLFTLMNALFDPILIFPLGLGAAGAAAGTAIAQTLALYPLLRALSKKVGASGNSDVPALFACASRQSLQDSLKKYANAGGFVLLRTLGKIAAYSICAREASKLGAVAAAAHNVCFQLGVATTQLCESAAVAIQALLAREAKLRVSPDRATADAAMMRARYVVGRGVLVGGVISTSVSGFTYLTKESVVFALTTDAAVRAAALSIMPAVLLCQALKGLAYPINGALMGNLDWSFASVTMWLAQAGCAAVLLSGPVSLSRLWASFVALFAIQCGAGALRIVSDTGPWRNFLGWPKAD